MSERDLIPTPSNDHCTCCEVIGEDPACALHGYGTEWRKANPDLCPECDQESRSRCEYCHGSGLIADSGEAPPNFEWPEAVFNPVYDRTVADKLRKARALVERGWTRGQYCRDGRYCLAGAIKKAFSGDANSTFNEADPVGKAVGAIVIQAIGKPRAEVGTLYRWNDAQKSKHSVLMVLDRAIELAESVA
jgi:hypothetical protein